MKNSILFIYLFFNLLVQQAVENICHRSIYCGICSFCGESTNNYTSCFYYNILCQSDYLGLLEVYKYSPLLKNTLINLFKNDSDITNFCGQEEYNFESIASNITIFNNKDKIFPKDKYIHCHYLINTTNIIKNEPYLSFVLSNNSNSTELKSLQFELFTIYTNSQTKEKIEPIKYSNLQKYENLKLIEEIKIIDIFLDFLELNHDQPEEILEIKLNFKKNNTNSTSSSSFAGLITSLVGGFVAICVLIGILYATCHFRLVKVDQNGNEIRY